jgi:two-component system C4-dicarboxylate transport sensor histidine kinase DctB
MTAFRPVRALQDLLLVALVLCALAGVVALAWHAAFRWGVSEARRAEQRHLQFLASDLALALDKYETLPAALAGYPDQLELLRHPGDTARRDAVNHRFEELARRIHVTQIYLMDDRGNTLAASNWNSVHSFVGQNFEFRPYFRDALAQGSGRYYAVGTTSLEPGYFLAHRVPDVLAPGQLPQGVIAVKIQLEDIESSWGHDQSLLMLADQHGVVFLSNRPEWKFHTLATLDPATLAQIRAERQYGNAALETVPMRDDGDGLAKVALADPATPGRLRWLQVVGEQRDLGHMKWTLLSFATTGEIANLARSYAAMAGFAFAFMSLAALYARLRHRRNVERRRAQRTLERVHAELEQRISERTAVLVSANDELESKICELDRTQVALRAMQDELVQAGKLTVIGQMAVSITHEINQPLAALRALNDNALMLLDRGDDAAVHGNLESIRELTQRIATIVGQLKGFARKDDIRHSPVPVEPAIASAMAMVSADARRHGVEIVAHPVPEDLAVRGQAVRVEQILVNLLRNAIDACADCDTRRVDVHARRDGSSVNLVVSDSGAGIRPEARDRLFEPFFTTKPAGVGLGLGLAISGSIANALGGSLQAANREEGGAEFALRLPAAQWRGEQARATQRTIG